MGTCAKTYQITAQNKFCTSHCNECRSHRQASGQSWPTLANIWLAQLCWPHASRVPPKLTIFGKFPLSRTWACGEASSKTCSRGVVQDVREAVFCVASCICVATCPTSILSHLFLCVRCSAMSVAVPCPMAAQSQPRCHRPWRGPHHLCCARGGVCFNAPKAENHDGRAIERRPSRGLGKSGSALAALRATDLLTPSGCQKTDDPVPSKATRNLGRQIHTPNPADV